MFQENSTDISLFRTFIGIKIEENIANYYYPLIGPEIYFENHKSNVMLNANEFYLILSKKVPEITPELEKVADQKSPYKLAQCFAGFTTRSIKSGDNNTTLKCFKLAEHILKDGNDRVKNAIENIYMYSVIKEIRDQKKIINTIPVSLTSKYKSNKLFYS